MYPIILVALQESDFDQYIEQYKKNYQFSDTHTYIITPQERKSISIEQIRELKKELSIKSDKRLIIIKEFQTATAEAQNSLLKTLEEKTTRNQFIICSTHAGTILPTILSRSTVRNLKKEGTNATDTGFVARIESLIGSSSYSFLNESSFQAGSVEEASKLFSQIITGLRPKLQMGDPAATELIKRALSLSSLLMTNNLNPQLAIDQWCLAAKRVSIKS